MSIGTFGTLTVTELKTKKPKRKPSNQDKNGRYKCSGCGVANNDEDVVIAHVMSENECKASYYKDRG